MATALSVMDEQETQVAARIPIRATGTRAGASSELEASVRAAAGAPVMNLGGSPRAVVPLDRWLRILRAAGVK